MQHFSDAKITAAPVEVRKYPRLEWRFDGNSTISQVPEPGPYAAWAPLNDIEQVRLEDGKLVGRVTGK
ncbi:MAG: hypothetical protein O7A98_06520, partial [Acidobacteria bacterium]|nr:hypothetical protein [Acidobacteriota bacterium]